MAPHRRALLMCEFSSLNGGEHSLLAALPGLQSLGWRFQAIAPPGPLVERLREYRIEAQEAPELAESPRQPQRLRAALTERIAKLEFDLLHANSLAMGRILGPILPALRRPAIAHLRDIIGLRQQAIDDLNRFDRLVAVSQATAQWHVEQGIDADRVRVVPNGVDLSRFRPQRPAGWLHERIGVADRDAPLIGVVGQLGLRKGQDTLLLAAKMVQEQFPSVHWLFVGDQPSRKQETTDYVAKLKELAAGPLAKNVHFLGRLECLRDFYPELTLLAHAARQEPLGRVLIEASACGIAVVATDVGGTREILFSGASADDEEAVLVPVDDPRTIAFRIIQILRDDNLRKRIGGAARTIAVERFDAVVSAQRLADVYDEAIAAFNGK